MNLINKDIGLDYGDQAEEIHGRMTSNCIIKSFFNRNVNYSDIEDSKVEQGTFLHIISESYDYLIY